MKKTILAISGWKKSGKDTSAEYIKSKVDNIQHLSFAKPLKISTASKYNIPIEFTEVQHLKEVAINSMPVVAKDSFSRMINNFLIKEFRTLTGHVVENTMIDPDCIYRCSETYEKLYWTPRALLILEGSVARSVDSNYWVSQAMSKLNPEKNYIISDLRYTNEVISLKTLQDTHNVVTLRINRFETTESNDPSERDLDNYNFDYIIRNNADLSYLKFELDNILKKELK